MTLKVAIQTVAVGENKVRLVLQNQIPVAEYNNKIFKHLWLLIDELKELSAHDHVQKFAVISNFLWKGKEYRVIDSIASYQKEYIERVDEERRCPADLFEYRLTDYKIFDISVMHDPIIEEGQIFYFVYNLSNGLPYRVVASFPYTELSSVVHYQILPLLEENR